MDTVAQLTSFISLGIAIGALMYARRQANSNQRAAESANRQARAAELDAKYPALLELLREFRDREFTATRHYIKNFLLIEYPPNGSGFRAISNQDRLLDVLALVHYLDNLGLFVRVSFVDSVYISIFIGKAIEDIWLVLSPYIKEERVSTLGYAENFAYLVEKCNATTQSNARRAL